jgi:hypothetical protein
MITPGFLAGAFRVNEENSIRALITKGIVGGSFTRNTRIAFGHCSDHLSYVSAKYNPIRSVHNAGIALSA